MNTVWMVMFWEVTSLSRKHLTWGLEILFESLKKVTGRKKTNLKSM